MKDQRPPVFQARGRIAAMLDRGWLERHGLSSSTLVALLLLLAALAALGTGIVAFLERDRAALVARFAGDRLKQLDEAAREVRDDLNDVAKDLHFAGRLLQTSSSAAERHRLLSALLGSVRPYRAAGVFSAPGGGAELAIDPRTDSPVPAELMAALSATAHRALASPPNRIVTSFPLDCRDGSWWRVFAMRLAGGNEAAAPAGAMAGASRPNRSPSSGPPPASPVAAAAASIGPRAIALLVDTRPFLGKLRLMASDPGSALLVLGPHGRPAPLSDPRLAAALADPSRSDGPGIQAALTLMKSGSSGTMTIHADEAARLGLPGADVIAAAAPVPLQGSAAWSVGLFSSTSVLRAVDKQMVWRLGLVVAGLAVALLAFGSYIVSSSRRAAVLQERLQHAAELAHAHEKAEKILENIPTGVIALSEDDRVTAMNRTLRDRLSCKVEGLPLTEAFPRAAPEAMQRVEELIARSRSEAAPRSLHGERLNLFGDDGQLSLHAVPLEHGFTDARLLLVLEDVTEMRALQSQLLRSEKLATVGILAAGVAHEIGTPLGVVRGRAEYILGKLGAGHREGPGLRVIMEQIDRIACTIRELLDFSRVTPAAATPVALAALVRRVTELLRFEAARRSVRFEARVSEDLPPLAADANQLQQVLVNLLMNACDACSSPAGGKPAAATVTVSATIELAASDEAAEVRIVVTDEGCGIAPENLHRVFDPFFTTKKRGQGTGLGLAIVQQIVRGHGAQIELTSTPEQGTSAILRWPTTTSKGRRDAA